MKKLLSRGFVVMLTAALLVTVALVTSCDGAVGKIIQGTEEDDFIPYDPPAGMGYIRIRLNKAARTVAPTLPDPEDLDYRIVILDKLNGPIYDSDVVDGLPIAYDDLEDLNIALEPDEDYQVTVTAYEHGDDTNIIGIDEITGVEVILGQGKTVEVKLKTQITGSGTGKFSYKIALPTNIASATGTYTAVLDVKTYPGKIYTTDIPSSLRNVDLKTPANLDNTLAPDSLKSGYYYFTITMNDPGAGPTTPPAFQKRTITNILHIYDNMTTDYGTSTIPNQLAALNVFSYTVTYDINGGDGALDLNSVGPLAHGSTLHKATQAPTDPVQGSLPLGYWSMTVPATAHSIWVFDDSIDPPPTKLIKAVTLHAIYNRDSPITLDIDWDVPSKPALNDATAAWNQAAYYNNVVQTATISFDDLNGFVIDEWSYDGGTTHIPGSPITEIVLSTLTGDDGYIAAGVHTFTILISKGGVSHSIDFVLTVTATP